MSFKPDVVGRGYLQTALRVERRPGRLPHLPTREEMLELLEWMDEAGVQAWWYSVCAKGCYPIFPSKYLPHHPDAQEGLYEWFTEECHRRDIVIASWAYLNTSPYLTQEHPDWCQQFLEPIHPVQLSDEAREYQAERHLRLYGMQNPVPCLNSPYGQLLKDFCVEVVNDLGFDGIWFDGYGIGAPTTWPAPKMGCCCPRCAKQFKDETGLDMPMFEDYSNADFRRFLQWRQQFLAKYSYELAEYVRDHNKTALIAFKNHQPWARNQDVACPLVEVNWDALSTQELAGQPFHAMLMLKYLRAVSDRYTPELWTSPGGLDVVPDHLIYFGMLCMTSGGFCALGSPSDSIEFLQALGDALKPRAPYVGGQPWRYAGIVLSWNTKEFAFGGDHDPAWHSVHGIHNLLLHAHWPSEIILDNQVRLDYLKSFPVVILSDVRCLTNEQAQALEEYVEQGGLLLVTCQTGSMDDIGQPREKGVLDDLLGIVGRRTGKVPPRIVLPEGEWGAQLPSSFELSPPPHVPSAACEEDVWAEFTDDIEVLAYGGAAGKEGGAFTTSRESPGNAAHVLVTRKVGEGRVIYLNRDIGGYYSCAANRRYRELVIAALSQYTTPPFEVEALPHVVVTAWRQDDGRTFFHILSQPQNLRTLQAPGHVSSMDIGTIPPTGPVTIRVPGCIKQATRPVSGDPVDLEVADGISTIRIENVDKHDVLVVE